LIARGASWRLADRVDSPSSVSRRAWWTPVLGEFEPVDQRHQPAALRRRPPDCRPRHTARTQRELADYKLFVAQNHVSAAVLKDTELRLINAIEKLASRMEAIAEKFDERSRGS
jgi:hypothetical protein